MGRKLSTQGSEQNACAQDEDDHVSDDDGRKSESPWKAGTGETSDPGQERLPGKRRKGDSEDEQEVVRRRVQT